MKLNFRKPCIEDKEKFDKIFKSFGNINSESAFGTSYIWADSKDIKVCFEGDIFLKKVGNTYEFPVGTLDKLKIREIVDALKFDSEDYGKFIFKELMQNQVDILKEIFPNKFSYKEDRGDYEYIYSINDLANLKGKKYHSKRNHISKFNKMYSWEYSCDLDIKESIDFFEKWFITNKTEKKLDKIDEFSAIKKSIFNFKNLNLISGTIKIDNKIVACTIGEKINDKVLVVHFEKGFIEYEGIYSVINNEFCKSQLGKCNFVNREEDMNIPGLRKSKLSYKPRILLKKYSAILEE